MRKNEGKFLQLTYHDNWGLHCGGLEEREEGEEKN
jgi:hypothetical protein